MKLLAICALSALLSLASAAHDLSSYPFSATLLDKGEDSYELFWSFDRDLKNITFAVRVNTTGWVGFGLSPNGEMTNSDLVLGWVDADDNKRGYLNDRFATARDVPPVDDITNWFLLSSDEENGYTVLEFTRYWVTCDEEKDRVINGGTARIVFSWSDVDPTDNNPNGISPHGNARRGTMSLNLLGGNQNPPLDPPNSNFFEVDVTNVVILSSQSTTYWCAAVRLPEAVRNETQYVYKFSPDLTPHNFSYVHHMLVYLCNNGLAPADRDASNECFTGASPSVDACTSSQLIGAWAVGGTDFVYPEDVAFPIGGPGTPEYMVIEMHYDNPDFDAGEVDSSGFNFFYVSTPRKEDAGILFFGHDVQWNMLIPPKADDYKIVGMCAAGCTREHIPENGIKIFANILHTHLIGSGLTMKVIRTNQQCSRSEELKPVDQNLQYDFNFQQYTHFEDEFTILPGDVILLECNYKSNVPHVSGVTVGGLSTVEEMCLAFPVYYPRIPLVACSSIVGTSTEVEPFLRNYLSPENLANVLREPNNEDVVVSALNTLPWTSEQVQDLQTATLSESRLSFCVSDKNITKYLNPIPKPDCEYQAPNVCTRFSPTPCCERALGGGAPPTTPVSLLLVGLTACLVALSSGAGA